MRLLIDGYNVMHAAGLMGQKFGPDRFRQARQRFLSDLAALLEPDESGKTTVVFDAAAPPEHLPATTKHKGLSIVFAVNDDDADERIEALIAAHSAPRKLVVVSTDLRIRQAASRRKATPMTADAFLNELDRRRGRLRLRIGSNAKESMKDSPASANLVDPVESAYWKREFGQLDFDPDTAEALNEHSKMVSDADLERIRREVEAEFGPDPKQPKRPRR